MTRDRKEKPFTMLVIDAVLASDLPPDLRHLLMVMAYKATNSTGRGFTGQKNLAKEMGLAPGKDDKGGAREVRRKLDRLAQLTTSPVQVVRRKRGNAGGGRTSDEYQLVLAKRTSTSPTAEQSSGRPRPPQGTVDEATKADVGDTQSGRPRPTKADVHVRGSSQMILVDDPRSLFVAQESATPSAKKPKSKTNKKATKAKPKAERSDEQRAAHQQLTEHYFTEFERLRGAKPIGWGAKEGKAVWTLLEKLKFDTAAACRIVTNGLESWANATIMTISSNPSACVAGPRLAPGDVRAGGMLPGLMHRAARQRAEEQAEEQRKALA